MLLHRYTIRLAITGEIIFDHFPGFHLRNALVSAMTVHCRGAGRKRGSKVIRCHGCRYLGRCAYAELQLPVEEPDAAPGTMPFILDTSDIITGKYAGGVIEIGLTLAGKASRHEKKFAHAFQAVGQEYGLGENGKPGCFELISFEKNSSTDLEALISIENATTGKLEKPESIRLRFRHYRPPDQRFDSKPILPLPYLMRSIHARLRDLTNSFGEDEEEMEELSEEFMVRASEVKVKEQWARCNYRYPGSGMGYWFFSGYTAYNGKLNHAMGLLKAGSLAGIGRFTSYGFGIYTLNDGAAF